MRTRLTLLTTALLLSCGVATTWSSEADELRAKAKAVQREAEELAKQGRADEAEKLGRVVKELLQQAEKHDAAPAKEKDANVERQIDELHHQLKALAEKEEALRKDKNEEGLAELRKYRAAIEDKLASVQKHHEGKPGAKPVAKHHPEHEEVARRLKHMHAAIENLHAAGMKDLAAEVAERAQAMERELHQAHEPHAKEHVIAIKRKNFELAIDSGSEPKAARVEVKVGGQSGPIDELREELQRLRAELNELRGELKKRQ